MHSIQGNSQLDAYKPIVGKFKKNQTKRTPPSEAGQWKHDRYNPIESPKRASFSEPGQWRQEYYDPIERHKRTELSDTRNWKHTGCKQIKKLRKSPVNAAINTAKFSTKPFSQEVLRSLIDTLSSSSVSQDDITATGISKILTHLRGQSVILDDKKRHKQMDTLIYCLSTLLDNSSDVLNLFDLTCCLGPLHDFNVHMESNKKLLEVLSKKIPEMQEPFDATTVAIVCTSLKNMSSRSVITSQFITAVSDKIMTSDFNLDDENLLIQSFSGLKNLDSFHDCTESIINALTSKVTSAPFQTINAFSFCAKALEKKSSNSTAVRLLINKLRHKLEHSTCVFDEKALGGALFGLQKMTNDHQEVRDLLSVITQKLKAHSPLLSSHAIGISLCVFSNIHSSQECDDLLDVFTEMIDRQPNLEIEPKHLSIAICHLNYQTGSKVEDLIRLLFSRCQTRILLEDTPGLIRGISNKERLSDLVTKLFENIGDRHLSNASFEILRDLAEGISVMKYHYSNLRSKPYYNKMKKIINVFKDIADYKNQNRGHLRTFESNTYREILHHDPSLKNCLKAGFMHRSGYEMDFYDKDLRINFELDGDHHSNRKIQDELRDNVLNYVYSITTVRLHTHTPNRAAQEILGTIRDKETKVPGSSV